MRISSRKPARNSRDFSNHSLATCTSPAFAITTAAVLSGRKWSSRQGFVTQNNEVLVPRAQEEIGPQPRRPWLWSTSRFAPSRPTGRPPWKVCTLVVLEPESDHVQDHPCTLSNRVRRFHG